MSRGDSTAAFLSALAAELLAERDESRTVTTIVHRAVETIADAEHASLTVRATSGRRRRHVTVGSTDQRVAEADALQHDLEQGPCLDAATQGEWVRSGHVGGDPRWPDWAPRAAALGLGSVLSVPLDSAGRPLGSLNLYSGRLGCFVDPATVDLAVLFAVHAANALASAQQVAGLETALASRHVIGMAQGILMERYGLDEDRAFAFLSRLSSHQNLKLRDLATELVRTRTVPEPARRELLAEARGEPGVEPRDDLAPRVPD